MIHGQAMHSLDGYWGWKAVHSVMESLESGQVLTTRMGGGYPVALEVAMSRYYPPTNWWMQVGYDEGFGLFVALHLFIAGLGVWRWLKLLGAREGIALAAAVAWMWSPLMTGRLVLDTHLGLVAAAWMPFAFVAAHRCVLEGRAIHALSLGGVIALMLLGGHPPNAIMFGFSACGYALVFAWMQGVLSLRLAGGLAVSGLTAMALCVAPLHNLKTLAEEGPRTLRMGLDPATQGLPAESLLTIFVPGIFGRDYQGPGYLGRFFGSLNTLYVGAVWPLALMLRKRETRPAQEWALMLAGLGCALLAVGLPSPLMVLVQKAGFPLSLLRLPVRWVFPVMLMGLSLAALALERGWEADWQLPKWGRNLLVVLFGVGVAAGVFLLVLPEEIIHSITQWLMTDPARFAALDQVPLPVWRQTGVGLLLETIFFAGGTFGVLALLFKRRLFHALALSLALSAAAAAPDLLLSFHPREAPIPVPAAVGKDERILPLVTRWEEGAGTQMADLDTFTIDAAGHLWLQGYTVAMVHGGVPPVGWQSLLQGQRIDVNDTGWDVKKSLLDFLQVRWVVTRAAVPPECEEGQRSLRQQAFKAMDMPPPQGLTEAFMCLKQRSLQRFGFVEEPTANKDFRWWKNTFDQQPSVLLKPQPGGFLVSLKASGLRNFSVLPVPYWRHWIVRNSQGQLQSTFKSPDGLLGVNTVSGQINVSYAYPDEVLQKLMKGAWLLWAVLYGLLLIRERGIKNPNLV